VKPCRIGTAVGGGDLDQNVVGGRLGVLDDDVEIPVLVEDPRVGELELGFLSAAAAILFDEPLVRERLLRVLVEDLHGSVGWRAVQVVVMLLDVFAVVALRAAQAE